MDILDFSQGNPVFLERDLVCAPNWTSCSRNSTIELLHGEIGGAELKKLE
jgi:hypothetical protein